MNSNKYVVLYHLGKPIGYVLEENSYTQEVQKTLSKYLANGLTVQRKYLTALPQICKAKLASRFKPNFKGKI